MNKRKWISVIAAFWSAVAIALSGEFVEANGLLRTLNSELNGIRLDKLIVLAALVAFYYKVWDRFEKRVSGSPIFWLRSFRCAC